MKEAAVRGAEALEGGHVFDEEDVWYAADAIPNGSAAAIALIEHRWAIPLRDAIIDAGGFRSPTSGSTRPTSWQSAPSARPTRANAPRPRPRSRTRLIVAGERFQRFLDVVSERQPELRRSRRYARNAGRR
jgi:hypothetical protein